MSEAIRLLHALAHALATLSLYSPGHPATRRAVDQAFQALQALLDVDPRPNFLFLNTSAVYAGRALHELAEWPWTQRLSDAALQRVAFDARLTPDGMAAFLDLVMMRVATGDVAADDSGIEGVSFGAVSVLEEESAPTDAETEAAVEGSTEMQVELTDELDVVGFIFDEAAKGALARPEAEAVVRILDGILDTHALPQAIAGDARYSPLHAVNTALLSMACATSNGMDRTARQRIGLAALLHDLGMALIPAELTSKDSLTPEERARVESHTVRGARLLFEGGPGMALSATVAYEHHHRPDGTGYPVGRLRVSPHWASRLVSVTSAYTALRSPRPFRAAWAPERALRYLEDGAGTVFDGDIARLVAVLVRPAWTLSPRVQIAIAALLFSTGGAAIKATQFAGWQVASLRSGIAAVTLFLVLPAARRGMTWRSAVVAVAYAATLVSFVLANKLTTSANAIYLQSTAPLYLLLLGPVLLHERITRRDIPVLLAVIGGLILVFLGTDVPSSTATDPARGNIIALGSGLSYALMLCGLRWLGRDGDSRGEGLAAVVLGNAFACVAALPMALPITGGGLADWGSMLYLGVFQIALAYVLVTRGIRRVRALEVSLLLLVETALNPVWSWLLLGETASALAIAGGVLIVGATVLQSMRPPAAAGAA